MSAGLLGLIAVTLAAAITEIMMPGEAHKGTRHFLHFLTALTVLVLLLRPFLSLVDLSGGFLRGEVEWVEEESAPDFWAQLEKAVAERSTVMLREGLQAYLSEKCDLSPEHYELRIQLTEGGALAHVSVRLRGAGLLRDPDKIDASLRELLKCEVEVR